MNCFFITITEKNIRIFRTYDWRVDQVAWLSSQELAEAWLFELTASSVSVPSRRKIFNHFQRNALLSTRRLIATCVHRTYIIRCRSKFLFKCKSWRAAVTACKRILSKCQHNWLTIADDWDRIIHYGKFY